MLMGEITSGDFGTLRGDKTHGFILKTSLQITKLTILIHTLSFLSCVSLYSFSHLIT